ncbi:uncharacterized protein [Haliotis cracherodii]|uniref:uncharacterized protein n=1 Tax=Haliotis cracherodii TaxID=6455 RepID=UPI0039E994C1
MWRCVLVLLCLGGARPVFFGDSIREIKELSWVSTIDTSGPVRSSTGMPVRLHLMLHTLQGAMELNLTLSPVNTVNMPVYSIHNTGGNYTATRSQPLNEHCGIYRDIKHKGAFACRRETDGQFDIMGSLLLHGRQYRLWPAATNRADHAHIHVMRTVEEPAVRTSDFLIKNTSNILSEVGTVTPPSSRETTHIYTVELVMHTDYKDFTNFQQRFGLTSIPDTTSYMALWYATVAEFMTLTYGTIVEDNPDINIIVKALSLVIATSPGDSPWSENNVRTDGSIDATAAIHDFRSHRRVLVEQQAAPRGDHAMAFTGRSVVRIPSRYIGTQRGAEYVHIRFGQNKPQYPTMRPGTCLLLTGEHEAGRGVIPQMTSLPCEHADGVNLFGHVDKASDI